jgi:hypothetical protein
MNRTDYDRGELHASEDVAHYGLHHARGTAQRMGNLAWPNTPGDDDGGYSAGYVDELLWIASCGEVLVRAKMPWLLRAPTIAKTVARGLSRLDEQCHANMRSRERF